MPASRPSNRRIFPRYRTDLDFVFEVAGKRFNARLKDLSISGLGLEVDAHLQHLDLDTLDIKITEIGLETTGHTVWTGEQSSGVRIGLLRSGPLKGDIRNVRLADVLLGLRKMKRTGILHITTSCSVKEVYLKNGEVVFVTADPEDSEINDILLYSGKITLEQYDRAAQRIKTTGRSREAELVALGHIGPEDLLWAVRRQAEKIFMGLFELEEGSFFFLEGPVPANRFLSLPLEPVEFIFRAAKTLREDRLSTMVPDMNSVVYVPADKNIIQKGFKLSDNEKKVLLLVNGERTIREIATLSHVDEFETLRTFFALSCVQVVELGGPRDDILPPHAERDIADTQDGPGIEVMYKIDKLYREYKKLGYYGVLNVGRNAPLEEIKLAYRKMAKEYHPDRYLQFNSDPLREKLNIIFSYINEAYRSLTANQGATQSVLRPVYEGEKDRNRKMARQKFDEGMDWFGRQDFEEAVTLLGQAAYIDDSVPDYHYYYACSLIHNKMLKNAEESLRKALRLDPFNSGYATELGYVYLQLGFTARARNTFAKALKCDPSNHRASEGLKKCMQ